MSLNPFRADPAKRQRYELLAAQIGPALGTEIARRATVGNRHPDANLGSVLPAAEVAVLIRQFGLDDVDELMVLGLDAGRQLARPPISNFYVGSIGLEKETGNLILGGNVEFEGTSLGFTVHGEGFVFTRAFSRSTTISVLAIGEAHPCAHCRQYLSEFAATAEMRLVDPLGHELRMAELYPWPFDPNYLGEPGIIAGAVPFPRLGFIGGGPTDPAIAARLLEAGRRAHAPYGKNPTAVVLELRDGTLLAGSTIESVAFNPSIGALQAAIIDLLAHRRGYDEIAACWVGTMRDEPVRHERSTGELLGAIAPEAELTVFPWRP